jgi:predicted molibdopterin-dependent oxidoreductase YjgC
MIRHVARIYARAGVAMSIWTMGINQSTHGSDGVVDINNLNLITGNIGIPGGTSLSITGQCNAMGTRETSCTGSLPGYRKYESAADREDMARLWHVDVAEIPDKRGYAYPDIIEAIMQREIKALWIIATNPLVSFPNQEFLKDALGRLDFLVVQDAFHPTPTTELADLVLPASVWGEKEGTYTNSERRVSKANKAIQPPGEAMSDFDIFLEIARKLSVVEKIYPGWRNVGDAFNEWKQVSKGRLCDYSGITYDLLDKVGGVQWPFKEGDDPATALNPRRLYTDGKYEHDDGRAKFFPVENKDMPEKPNEEYPFVLNTGRTVEHWHTMTKTANVEILQKLSPEAWVEMNPADAEKLGLKQGEEVRVSSRRGSVEKITLRITEIIGEGQIFIPFHWFKTNANNLTLNAFDPISREPNYKQAAVRVEKAG